MRRRAVWLVVAAVGALVALGSAYAVQRTLGGAPDEDAGWLDSLADVQGTWVSTTGFARDGSTPWTTPVHLAVEGDRVRLDAGCNTMTGEVTLDDHRLDAGGGLATTEIGCPPDIAGTEGWLAAMVAARPQASLKGSTEGPMLALDSDAGWIGFVRR
ncbi:META domain-containing protein [Knoellia sp. CPCC 206450]|uniref:META domain-containing protein n=1 Tax=Knoellia tibetensis TaxID=3404798 RepID=UPI003B43B7B3